MKMPLADLRAAAPAAMPPQLPAQPAQAAHWKLELNHAATLLARPDPAAQGAGTRSDDDRAELESCGAPSVAGGPPPQQPDPVAPRNAPAEETSARSERTEREVERSPVRLHVQGLPAEAVKVWLGIDGDAALVAQRASAAVADLRRNLQSATGGRVASIVCNGVLVYPRPPSSAAPLAPTHPLFLKDSP